MFFFNNLHVPHGALSLWTLNAELRSEGLDSLSRLEPTALPAASLLAAAIVSGGVESPCRRWPPCVQVGLGDD